MEVADCYKYFPHLYSWWRWFKLHFVKTRITLLLPRDSHRTFKAPHLSHSTILLLIKRSTHRVAAQQKRYGLNRYSDEEFVRLHGAFQLNHLSNEINQACQPTLTTTSWKTWGVIIDMQDPTINVFYGNRVETFDDFYSLSLLKCGKVGTSKWVVTLLPSLRSDGWNSTGTPSLVKTLSCSIWESSVMTKGQPIHWVSVLWPNPTYVYPSMPASALMIPPISAETGCSSPASYLPATDVH